MFSKKVKVPIVGTNSCIRVKPSHPLATKSSVRFEELVEHVSCKVLDFESLRKKRY
jgi:hypothetical protein